MSKEGSSIAGDSVFVIHQYNPMADSLSDKVRCDDAVSSSATHGSDSTATETAPTSNGKATNDGEYDDPTRKSSPDTSNRTHMFSKNTHSTNCGSSEDSTYCLGRFLRDIDPREMTRLGYPDGIARGRSLERREDGAGRPREKPLRNRGCYDQTRVVEERGEEKEKDGAA